MLKEMHTVLPAADLGRAQKFYHDMLDMDPTMTLEDGAMLHYGSMDSGFDIYETENAGTAQNTQMAWMTDDLDGDMRTLRERGVVFEDFEVPGVKTENGVAEEEGMRSAWFRDSEGNFIVLTELNEASRRMMMERGQAEMGGSSTGGSQMGGSQTDTSAGRM
jgi:predicted enzyme related to lactoylglutathione lyase